MLTRKISFNQAFDQVKKARSIAGPNIGFAVSLLQWHRRITSPLPIKNETDDLIQIYRIAPHRPGFDNILVAKSIESSPHNLDTRSVCVLHTRKLLYIWIGQRAESQYSHAAQQFALQVLIARLRKYEHATMEEPITIHEQVEGVQVFRRLFPRDLNMPSGPIEVAAFSQDYECGWTSPSQQVAKQIDPSSADNADELLSPKSTSTYSADFPKLFQVYPDVHEIELFDASDLNDEEAFVLFGKDSNSNKLKAHLWIGDECSVREEKNDLGTWTLEVVRRCARDIYIDPDLSIQNEESGRESDDFWDAF
jgi:hypothetical protein